MTAANKPKAIVIGVGPQKGLGGALCRRFSSAGLHVFICGRTMEKLELVAESICRHGGSATPVVCDTTNEDQVVGLFDTVLRIGDGAIDLAVYNVGNNIPGKIRDMSAGKFERAWRQLCFGGFLFGRECTRRMLPTGGTLIFTGASASLRGKAGYGVFNSGKSALRVLAQAMAKEYAAEGLHVGHVVVDGSIAGDKWLGRVGVEPDAEMMKRCVSLDALADAYWYLYKQKPAGWSFEIDLRTAIENW